MRRPKLIKRFMESKDFEKVKKLSEQSELGFKDAVNKVCGNCPRSTFKNAVFVRLIYHRIFSDKIESKSAGCCTLCKANEAYFYLSHHEAMGGLYGIFLNQFNYLKQNYRWDKRDGFFDMKNKGCKLPRMFRSKTCLDQICYDLEKELTQKKKDSLRCINIKMDNIKGRYGIIC